MLRRFDDDDSVSHQINTELREDIWVKYLGPSGVEDQIDSIA
jgi:hypothetical protein